MSDQYVTGNFPTMERLALCHLREQFPGLKRNGFMAALAHAADIYRKAAIKSQDFAGVATACHDFREPLARAIEHAAPTLTWLAARALELDPSPLVEKPALTVVPKAPVEPPSMVRVFSIQPVSYVAGATDLLDPAKVIRKNRFQNFQVSEAQARVGFANNWLLPEDHPSTEELRKRRYDDQPPAAHLTHSLDEPVPVPQMLLPDAGDDPVLKAANFQPLRRSPAIAPTMPDAAPRVAAGGGMRKMPLLPEGFELHPRAHAGPQTVVIKPGRVDDDEEKS